MQIAQVTATFPPYFGGTGNVCYYQAKGLALLGHDVHVYTCFLGEGCREEKVEGFSINRLQPLIKARNSALLPSLFNALIGYDVIHLHYPFFGGELATIASITRKIPLVITYHQDVLMKGFYGFVERIVRYSIGISTLRAARRVLFTSLDYYQNSYARNLLIGRESHVSELANGVDIERFNLKRRSLNIEKQYKSSPDQFIALLVAGLDKPHYFKGVDNFLKALSLLPSRVLGIIVGDGDLKPEYEKKAKAYKLEERVRFIGRVTFEDLPDYYTNADVTVLPSTTMGEAFGLVLIESLACGTPVIASNLPGVRTVVNDGQDGFLIQPNNIEDLITKMLILIEDPSLKKVLGAKGRAKVEQKYAWPSIVNRLESIYTQVVR